MARNKYHIDTANKPAAEEIDKLRKALEDKNWIIEKTDAALKALYGELEQTIKALEETKASLENKVRERTRDLDILNKALSRELIQRKQMQDELANHRDHLEKTVRERTAELTKANQQLNLHIKEREQGEVLLQKRSDELNTMVKLMAGRENRMVELKKVIKKLRAQLEEAGMTPVADDPLKKRDL